MRKVFNRDDWIMLISFIVFWMLPLFFEPNTNLRWAMEELRVLLAGLYVMYLLRRDRQQ